MQNGVNHRMLFFFSFFFFCALCCKEVKVAAKLGEDTGSTLTFARPLSLTYCRPAAASLLDDMAGKLIPSRFCQKWTLRHATHRNVINQLSSFFFYIMIKLSYVESYWGSESIPAAQASMFWAFFSAELSRLCPSQPAGECNSALFSKSLTSTHYFIAAAIDSVLKLGLRNTSTILICPATSAQTFRW